MELHRLGQRHRPTMRLSGKLLRQLLYWDKDEYDPSHVSDIPNNF